MTAKGRILPLIWLMLAFALAPIVLGFDGQAQARPDAYGPPAPAPRPVIITELRWDGESVIIGTDKPLRFRSFSLREPDRVVVDLFDAELGDPTMSRVMAVQREPIRQIRLGDHPEEGFLRVVIDGERPIPVQISQPQGLSQLVIRAQEPAAAEPAKEEPSPEELSPSLPSPSPGAPRAIKLAADPPGRQASPETYGPPERFGPPASLKAAEPERPASMRSAAKPKRVPSPAPQASPRAARAVQGEERPRNPGPRSDREEVGVQLTHAGDRTELRLQGYRTLHLRIQQAADPARLLVQIPSGALRGKLPRAAGQVSALEAREEGGSWVLEARLEEVALDVRNRMEDDGKTLVLAIRPQGVMSTKQPVVLIDPGHGGDDPGALGAGGARESEINLAIARKLQEALRNRGVNAVLTRTGDVNVDLESRARLIDQLGARALVSVHMNSHDAASALGVETYYRTSASQAFAQQIHRELVSELQRPDRGVREARLFVLRHPTIPSALIEAGFLSNPEEEGLLADADYQRRAAEAIARGVAGYLSTSVAELVP